MKELSDVHLRGESQRVQPKPSKEQPTERRTLPKVDPDAYKTITPYKEERPSIMPFINVVVGMVIGLALMYFLIIPHMKSKMQTVRIIILNSTVSSRQQMIVIHHL